jgi:hypothetical protein
MRGRFFLTVVELTIRVLMGVIPSCWANSSCTAEANGSLPAGETAASGFEDQGESVEAGGSDEWEFRPGGITALKTGERMIVSIS